MNKTTDVLLIDNYDSFVYNVRDYILVLGVSVILKKNDEITISDIKKIKPKAIVISPGPCSPDQAGLTLQIISTFQNTPIFGICLGHQAIAQSFGAKIRKGKKPMHGIISKIIHRNGSLFKNIPNTFHAVKYHSLIVDYNTLPNCLEITALDSNKTIMSISHKQLDIHGVQFHPESICSEFGSQIFINFLKIAKIL